MNLIQQLKEYIQAELNDSALYRELSKNAPSQDAKLLQEFSADELRHAREFQGVLASMTGCKFSPEVRVNIPKGSYRDILLDRVLDESGDFRKYGQQYLITCQNDCLRDIFFRAHLDEGVHAMRLLAMAAAQDMCESENEKY